jgi:predicted nucleic acid-binding protein
LKTVLVDASSAILLHKADLLLEMQAAFRLCVTASVYGELTHYQRPGARAFARSCRDHQISILTPNCASGSHALPANLHQGERDTLLCFLDGGADFIIIDDGRGAGFCRRMAIPYVNALLCPRMLASADRLTPAGAREAMARIADLGRYSNWVKHYAATCSDTALSAFLP